MPRGFEQTGKRDILLVDDDDSCRRCLGEFLHTFGYPFREATNGAEALTILQTGSVRLVLLDIQMPTMNGVQLLEIMQTTPFLQHIPVIILTGEASSEVLQRVTQVNVREILPKPYDFQSIALAVARALAPPDES